MTPFQIIEAEMIKRGERIDALEAEKKALKKDVERLYKVFRKYYWRCETLETDKRELEEEVHLLQVALKQK